MRANTWLGYSGSAVAVATLVQLVWTATKAQYNPEPLMQAEAKVLQGVKTPFRQTFVQVGEHQINTLVAGEGPPLVLLHGHGGGIGVWCNNIDALARRYQVHVIDWLGWGRSSRPYFGGRTPEEARAWWLEALEAWRQAMGLARFTLLGHSLGGWLAMEYALCHEERLAQLILVNPAGVQDDVTLLKGLCYYISPQRIVRACGPLGPQLVTKNYRYQVDLCPTVGNALLDYYYHLSCAPLSGQLAFERILSPRHWAFPLVGRVGQMTVPTTILWGQQDSLLPRHHGPLLNGQLPNSRLVFFPYAGHNPHIEASLRFNEAITQMGEAPNTPLAQAA